MMTMILAAALAAPELSVAYHGDLLVHPGTSARLTQWWGPVGLEAQSGMYWHPKNQVAVHVRGGPAVRFEGPKHGTWGAFAHVGGIHGFWAARTYSVGTDVRTKPLAGDTWFALTPGIELGRCTPEKWMAGWFVRPQLGLRFPTFHGHGTDVAIEIGGRW